MTVPAVAAKEIVFSPRRRRLRRRILGFSFLFAFIASLLAGALFTVSEIYLPSRKLEETNRKTFEKIRCGIEICDVSELSDWDFVGSDWVLDRTSYFFLSVAPPGGEFSKFPLHFSDPGFVKRFEQPGTFDSPSGEKWRLYSSEKRLGNKRIGIMVGYAVKASWKMDLPSGPNSTIDAALREQLKRIENALREEDGRIETANASLRRIAADGYEIVDLTSARILYGGFDIPVLFPHGKPLPRQGLSFYQDNYDLFLVRTDVNERLLAVSTVNVGDLRSLVVLFTLLLTISTLAAYLFGATVLRKYFLFSQSRPPTVEEAIKLGEGPNVEFKQNISFEGSSSLGEILETVTAFANTGDGAIFIGVDDAARIKGITIEGPKHKDQISHRIHEAVRLRVRPSPAIQVTFVEIRTFKICVIFVPRGEEPLHLLDGTIYVRYGSSDIKAQPEVVKRLMANYEF